MAVREEMPARAAERDANRLVAADWPSRPFPSVPVRRGDGFQVVCRRSVLNAIQGHGREQLDIEVCGVLVGGVYHDEVGPFLYVEACIRGEHAGNLAAQVTFTSETWTHIHQRMEEYPGQRILGWYHTHPDFGIFLSAADLFIHENFFNLPWQVAYVYDPVRGEEGMFVWRNTRATREPFLVEEDTAMAPARAVDNASMIREALGERLERLERRTAALAVALVGVGLLALVWPEAWPWLRAWLERPAAVQEETPPNGSSPEGDRVRPIEPSLRGSDSGS